MSEAPSSWPFLDSNIFLRFVMGDSESQSPACASLFDRVANHGLIVQTSPTVVLETVFTLQSFYKVPRDEIRTSLLPLLILDNLIVTDCEIYDRVFDLYVSTRSLSFADAYHAVLAHKLGCGQFVSFDRDFDRIPGLVRTTPDQVS